MHKGRAGDAVLYMRAGNAGLGNHELCQLPDKACVQKALP